MDLEVRGKALQAQKQLLCAIHSHKLCSAKLLNGDTSEDLQNELKNIRNQIHDCLEKQKALLEELNKSTKGEPFKFNIHDLPEGAKPKKSRRRKDSMHHSKTGRKVNGTTSQSCDKSSSSSTESGDSDDVDSGDDLDSELPLYLPMARENTEIQPSLPSRQEVRYPKIRRRVNLTEQQEAELSRALPVYPPTVPTPPPRDEHEAKTRFMAAMGLIPKEALAELLLKKSERKRRSAAINSYVNTNDKQQFSLKRQYLTPAKKPPKQNLKTEKKKIVQEDEDSPEENNDSARSSKLIEPSESSKLDASNGSPGEVTTSNQGTDNARSLLKDKSKVRLQMFRVLQTRVKEKEELEKKVLTLSERLALQERIKEGLLEEQVELESKVDSLREFVSTFQAKSPSPVDLGRLPPDCSPLPRSRSPTPSIGSGDGENALNDSFGKVVTGSISSCEEIPSTSSSSSGRNDQPAQNNPSQNEPKKEDGQSENPTRSRTLSMFLRSLKPPPDPSMYPLRIADVFNKSIFGVDELPSFSIDVPPGVALPVPDNDEDIVFPFSTELFQ